MTEQFTPLQIEKLFETLNSLVQTGDIFYRSSDVYSAEGIPFSMLVAHATQSPFSHAALASRQLTDVNVLEINENGTTFPTLREWLSNRYGKDLVVYRLKETSAAITAAFDEFIANVLRRKPLYDFAFNDADKFYCTEMVFKAYEQCANIQLQKPDVLYDIIKHPNLWSPVFTAANLVLQSIGSPCHVPTDRPLYYPGSETRGMMSSRWTECIFDARKYLA